MKLTLMTILFILGLPTILLILLILIFAIKWYHFKPWFIKLVLMQQLSLKRIPTGPYHIYIANMLYLEQTKMPLIDTPFYATDFGPCMKLYAKLQTKSPKNPHFYHKQLPQPKKNS